MRESAISIVTPVYNAELILPELHARLVSSLSHITDNFEIIMVNDASPQHDWDVIKSIANKDKRVKGINLSRNFGQHAAISAGLEYCTGEWIVVMDCDLQDQPEEIIKLYHKSQEGFQVVVGKRMRRKDFIFKKLFSRVFYNLFNYLTEQNLDNRVANFGIYSRKVIDNVRLYKEKDRSFGLLVALVGFSRVEVDVVHAKRARGSSSYNFKKRINLAMGHILSHSNKPLKLAVKMGFLFTAGSIIYASWLIIAYFLYSNVANGWTSLMVSLFFLAGLIIAVVGMVGLYVGKIYDEVKERPLYNIAETTFD
jgi:glycosyltransferase involved in cell wall biosynthesis